MKKISIITINDYTNYGNRLQNYASQEVLKSLGFHVETTVLRNNSKFRNLSGKTIKELYVIIISKIKRIIYMNKMNKMNKRKSKRIELFKQFTKTNILESEYIISNNDALINLNDAFDYFIVGSDQVWNPVFRFGSSIDFLTFASKEKRIAYSPSFGISEIPTEYKQRYQIWLSEMYRLSVREEAGAKIIKELTGRDADVLIDPTLMITKEKWISIAKEASSKPVDKYLLTYFLGGISKNDNKRIMEIAMEKKLKVVNLNDIKDYERYIIDPSEFLDFINSATVLCTDSFHGVIFSILMETPIVIFDRMGTVPSMNSRLETLLTTFKLESRMLKNIKTNDQVFDIDYAHIAPILEVERKKTINYLRESLNIESKIQ